MSRKRTRRLVRRFFLTVVLPGVLCVVGSSRARAQEPAAPVEGEGTVRVADGYFVASIFAGGAIFIVTKSARR